MTARSKGILQDIRDMISRHFSLKDDKADDHTIDQALRSGVEMKGTNLWVLMFAIFVASIGLNVNSTAVIIGAMLISPLMGPIMGIGYGVGILDFPLMRLALKNLGFAILIGLLTSSVYFFFSPLTLPQSELLSRTTPTIWDVLIALFGGFAGIIGATRKERSNVIPGVAIATALMPPLCTAGFGFAHGNWSFFFGALYLFTINCVFIAFSSAVIVRAFHVRKKQFSDEQAAIRVGRFVTLIVLLTVTPSFYLAYLLVQKELFETRAVHFLGQELDSKVSHIAKTRIDPKKRLIEVTMVGEFIPPSKLASIVDRLPASGLAGAKLVVRQSNQRPIDLSTLKTGLLNDLYIQGRIPVEKKDRTIQQLQTSLDRREIHDRMLKGIPEELHALFPQIMGIWVSKAFDWDRKTGLKSQPTVLIVLDVAADHPINRRERTRIEKWALVRVKPERVKLVVESGRQTG